MTKKKEPEPMHKGGARPGAGRKPRPDSFKAQDTVSVALRPDQRSYIDRVADENGVTTSEAVRVVVNDNMARFMDGKEDTPVPISLEALTRRVITAMEARMDVHMPAEIQDDIVRGTLDKLKRA